MTPETEKRKAESQTLSGLRSPVSALPSCRPPFAFLLALALVLGGCAGTTPLGKESVIQKAQPPEDNRPFWKRLLLSIRPDIKPLDNYYGLRGQAKF
jgi:hypothetical protein